MTASVRVARYLLDLAKRHGVATPIDLPMSRRGMADHLGLPVEMVCRVLSRFAEARLITIPNVSQVEIIDVTALDAIIDANQTCPA
jgi:CRP-like cAMP-binding protein